MNQNLRTSQLLQCLKAVILQDKHAIETLRECEKTAGVEIYTTPLSFRVPIEYFSLFERPCDCSFEHEYFDYLQNGQCNQDMFDRICSNLDNGQCEHFSEDNSICDISATVYLIHAAVATNDKKITKYISRQILKRSRECLDNLTTGSGALTAAHIAVVKGSKDALQYVTGMYVGKNVSNDRLQCYLHGTEGEAPFSVHKRNDSTGKVERIETGDNSVLVSLLKLYRSPFQLNILLQLLSVLDQDGLEDLMQNHLSKGEAELAQFLLNDANHKNMRLDSSILLNAIFTHAHDFVKIWIRNKQSLSVKLMGVKIHVLFIAEALGCQKCTLSVSRGIKKDQNTHFENDRPTYERTDICPYIVACDSAKRFEYETDILLRILKNIFNKGSCSLHKRNRLSETVLHVLAKSDFYDNEVMECLLDLGSDVNACDDNGNTPLHVVVNSSNCSVVAVKCLLEHGADINLSNSNGQTPFMELLRKAKQSSSCFRYYFLFDSTLGSQKDNLLECMKYMLYYNPCVDKHPDVLACVENIDCDNTFDGYTKLPIVPSDRKMSLFAVLLELGFMNFQKEESDLVRHDDILLFLFNRHSIFRYSRRIGFDNYFKQFTSQPRSLQSICRAQIRQAFPGYRLHKLFKVIKLPKTLREYILLKDVLLYNDSCCSDA